MRPVLLLLLLITVVTGAVKGQSDKSPTVRYLLKRGYTFPDSTTIDSPRKWPDTVYYNTAYKAVLFGSPTIPISFTSIENATGQYEVSPTLSLGIGYTWFIGDIIFNENDKIIIDPKFYFGPIIDAALQNDFDLNKVTNVFAGGFIGFGSFSLFFGYDFINRSPNVGIGGRIDLFTISQNTLKPWGKVKEVRKHKKIAIPIANE